jgi:hypothetical protein
MNLPKTSILNSCFSLMKSKFFREFCCSLVTNRFYSNHVQQMQQ